MMIEITIRSVNGSEAFSEKHRSKRANKRSDIDPFRGLGADAKRLATALQIHHLPATLAARLLRRTNLFRLKPLVSRT